MSRLAFLVLPLLMSFAVQAQLSPLYPRNGLKADPSTSPNPADQIAQNLCEQIYSGRPFRYDSIFDTNFRIAHPELIFRDQLREVIEAAGYCTSMKAIPVAKPNPAQPPQFRARFYGDTDASAKLAMSGSLGQTVYFDIKYNSANQVTSLNIADMVFPQVIIHTWSDVSYQLSRLQGVVTMTAGSFAGLTDIRPQQAQPIGNASGLYVLKALEEAIYANQTRWTDTYAIRDDWKSFPASDMQLMPAGRVVSIANFADNMTRLNDNTAMDHLIRLMGRQAVEIAMTKGGMANPLLPFMRTDEVFKLKWGAPTDWAQKYVAMNNDDKADFLDGDLAKVPLASVGRNGVSMFQPTYVRDVEWIATTRDLCNVMQSFLVRHDSTVLRILGGNTGLVDAGAGRPAQFAAYKMGSEPGALSMTYMILDRRNQWGCVSAAWSNPSRNVNSWILRDIMHKSLKVYDPDLN